MLKLRFFDFEVFPNWWCCVFGDEPEDWNTYNKNIDDVKKTFKVVSSDDEDARKNLMKLMKEEGYCVTGYNIKYYDLVIANCIYQGFSPQQVKIVNDIIINPSLAYSSKEHIRLSPFAKKKIQGVSYQDLMNDATGSLKEKEAILGLDILESSVPFDKENLTNDDKEDIIFYCKQDVYAAMEWYKQVVKPYSTTKLIAAKVFGVDEVTARRITNAALVGMALGARRREFTDEDDPVIIPSDIKEYVYENVPSNVIEHLLNSKDGIDVEMFDNEVNFGNGGIHSVYKPNLYIESNDEWVLMDVDATSYYPSLLIQQNCLSRCISDPKKYEWIFNERVRIKHLKDKTKRDEEAQLAYKLILNTSFGASGNKYLEMYDPHQCTRTCRLGQLFLAALSNKLVKMVPDLKVIQTNTDGIFIYVRRKYLDKVRELEQEWTRYTRINMEEKVIKRMWQRDVNNYLIVNEDGSYTTKGGWLNQDRFRPGYVMISPLAAFVSAKAVREFLINGTPVVETIVKNKNIEDFVIVCKKGPTYSKVVQKMSDGSEVDLYKCNRVIATKDQSLGRLYKIKMYKGKASYTQMANTPEHCLTINYDLSTYNFNDIKHKIDYMYYVQRSFDLLNMQWLTFDDGKLIYENRFRPE